MMAIVFPILAIVMIGFLFQLRAADRAPMGYQDETGFNYGLPTHQSAEDNSFQPVPAFAFQSGRQHGPTPRRVAVVSAHHA